MSKPNILVIMSDQHHKDAMGYVGKHPVRTPNLDKLASEGMSFTSAYTAAPLCVPARSSFMTSSYPYRNQVWDNIEALSDISLTWPMYLKEADYHTALIGRMHFHQDQLHGFDEHPFGEYLSGEAMKKMKDIPEGQGLHAFQMSGHGDTAYHWRDKEITNAACDWLLKRADKPEPFAAVIGGFLPHSPYIAPKELIEYYLPLVELPKIEELQPETITRKRKALNMPNADDIERIRWNRAAYYALCEIMDDNIGTILKTLDDTGLAKNTLVIYTSDHGDHIGEHGCWWKSAYYEGAAGIPLIARFPDEITPNSKCDNVVNLIDIGPTIAEFADAPKMTDADGHSMLKLLRGEKNDWKDETFSEFCEYKCESYDSSEQFPCYPSRMIRSGPWKLWYYADDAKLPPALFNLDDDPGEKNNLINNIDYADIQKDLMSRLLKDWNPKQVKERSQRNHRIFIDIMSWQKKIGYPHGLADLKVPNGINDNIEIIKYEK